MPLSEYEQRVLHQMEQQLRSEDPKLASGLGTRPRIDARRILGAIALVVAGLAALLAGVSQSWIWLGVIGFLLMLAGVMVVVGAPKRPGGGTPRGANGGGGGGARTQRPGPGGSDSFMKRQSEKWERRQQGGTH